MNIYALIDVIPDTHPELMPAHVIRSDVQGDINLLSLGVLGAYYSIGIPTTCTSGKTTCSKQKLNPMLIAIRKSDFSQWVSDSKTIWNLLRSPMALGTGLRTIRKARHFRSIDSAKIRTNESHLSK